MTVSNDQIVSFVQEKIAEKNEVIREQQLQIQDLQQKIADLERQLDETRAHAADREELFKKISAIVD
jgi:cell division protein FtsL